MAESKKIYKIHAEMCKVFSNPTRLEILNHLRDAEISVSGLIKKTGLSQANVSQHLAIMKLNGIVSANRIGKNIYYKISNPKISKAFDIIREVLVERFRKDVEIVERR